MRMALMRVLWTCVWISYCMQVSFAFECPAGTYLFDNVCYSCEIGCSSCFKDLLFVNGVPVWATGSTCQVCANRYVLSSSGVCESCPANCVTCRRIQATYDVCLTCDRGYRLVGDRCALICPENCETCEGIPFWTLKCTKCNPGFAFEDEVSKTCVQCEDNCRSCTDYVGACTSCQAGFYRDQNTPPFRTCLACNVCSPGSIEISACVTAGNRGCRACSPDQVVINNQCVTCTPGTYTSNDRLSCPTCSVCAAPSFYLKNGDACILTRNTICTACPDNKATSRNDLATCDICAAGYFQQQTQSNFFCARCLDYPCAINQYISCINGVRQCLACPGQTASTKCPVGQEPDKVCDGRSLQSSVCQDCRAGSERPIGAVSLICEKCKTGFYKTAAGVNNCVACTNAPGNGTYLPWGNTLANTQDCIW